jgi:photosystem II stability/assembly factor-like uncharacterized protein
MSVALRPAIVIGLVSIALFFAPRSTAEAHAGVIPLAHGVLFHPDDERVIVVITSVGLFVSDDAGDTFSWVCYEAVPRARLGEYPAVVLGADDSLVLANRTGGLIRGTDLGCAFEAPDETLESMFVIDVARASTPPAGVLALLSNGVGRNTLYASRDDGERWAQVGAHFEDGFLPENVRVSTAHPELRYVSGGFPPMDDVGRRALLQRSDDGGDTYAAYPIELRDGELTVHVVGIHPSDPARVYVRVRAAEWDRLLESRDGGASFEEISQIRARSISRVEPFAFAFGGDGAIWYGNAVAGLHRYTEEAGPVLVDADVRASCAEVRANELWVCADGFRNDFILAKSADVPTPAFEPVMTHDDVVSVRACTDGEVTATCDEWWPDLLADLGRALVANDAGPGGGEADAGPSGPPVLVDPPDRIPGGGCAVLRFEDDLERGSAALAFAAVACLVVRRRRS